MDEKEIAYKITMRRDSERILMGVLFTIVIAALWFIVLGCGIESRLADGLLGATVTAFILMVQFFFRSSGSK